MGYRGTVIFGRCVITIVWSHLFSETKDSQNSIPGTTKRPYFYLKFLRKIKFAVDQKDARVEGALFVIVDRVDCKVFPYPFTYPF